LKQTVPGKADEAQPQPKLEEKLRAGAAGRRFLSSEQRRRGSQTKPGSQLAVKSDGFHKAAPHSAREKFMGTQLPPVQSPLVAAT